GYHDVAITFLLVVGEMKAFRILEVLSNDHLSENMRDTMDETSYVLNYMFPLVNKRSSDLCEFLESACTCRNYREKERELKEIISQNKQLSVEQLRHYAKSPGDDIRQELWHRLLEIDLSAPCENSNKNDLLSHSEYSQVVLDVNRSLKRFPPGIPIEQRLALQDQLTLLILKVIHAYPRLRYYQGYHDVAITFLLVVGEMKAFRILEVLSNDHLSENMRDTMDETSYVLNYMFPLVNKRSSDLCEFLE
ncbi:TBC1 domain family member 20-like, partial [Diaphorina citri]|uniref:TBC1 domain family member 20-like n=1 Tax=Diaphorina citri TaxID=121845 RepID=A0A1S3DTP5_DIACI